MGRDFTSSVSPKGQITLPVEVRRLLHINTRDKVVIHLEDDGHVTISKPGRTMLDKLFMSVPGLKTPLTDNEMTEIAADEHAEKTARDGL